jgi:hypothetical protein
MRVCLGMCLLLSFEFDLYTIPLNDSKWIVMQNRRGEEDVRGMDNQETTNRRVQEYQIQEQHGFLSIERTQQLFVPF